MPRSKKLYTKAEHILHQSIISKLFFFLRGSVGAERRKKVCSRLGKEMTRKAPQTYYLFLLFRVLATKNSFSTLHKFKKV